MKEPSNVPATRPAVRKSGGKWYLVTNQQNMLYMLAGGLVTGPSGFQGNHYADSLSFNPGWAPLFKDRVPTDALKQAVSERKHLRPCIASFDLRNFSGQLRLLARDGATRNATSPTEKKSTDVAILIRTPLPLSLMSSIIFSSEEDKRDFEIAAGDVANVDLSCHSVDVSQSLFTETATTTWPPVLMQKGLSWSSDGPGEEQGANGEILKDDDRPALGQAVGGVLAMLYHAANRSDFGVAVYRWATDIESDPNRQLIKSETILEELPHWIRYGRISDSADQPSKLYWGAVQALVADQQHEPSLGPLEVVLDYLGKELEQSSEERVRRQLERLIADMRGCVGLGNSTVRELFERHPRPLSRSLLLYCLRRDGVELLQFSHPLLGDPEYALASILFGVRDGWLKMPRELRTPGLSSYVTQHIAQVEHLRRAVTMTLSPVSRPIPWRETIVEATGGWEGMKAMALKLARENLWTECIQTRVSFPEGSDPERFERSGSQLVFPCEVSVAVEVNKGAFFERLRQRPAGDAKLLARLLKN